MPVPRVVVPSLKVTVPVGVPLPGAAALDRGREGHRLAEAEGLTEEVSAVRRAGLVDGLGQRRRGAGGEVRVAAVDRGDGVRARPPASRS